MSNRQKCILSDSDIFGDTVSNADSAFIETSRISECCVDCINVGEICPEMSQCDVNRLHMNNYTNNWKADSGILECENNSMESTKLIDFEKSKESFFQNCGILAIDFTYNENDSEVKDSEFQDASKFFNNKLSLISFENDSSSNNSSESFLCKTSLYQKFDPLCSPELNTESSKKHESDNLDNIFLSHLQNETQDAKFQDNTNAELTELESNELKINMSYGIHVNQSVPHVVHKRFSNVSLQQYLENQLISFDLSIADEIRNSKFQTEKKCNYKKYTEEEFKHILKVQELAIKESFLRKEQELKKKLLKRYEGKKVEFKEFQHQKRQCNYLYEISKEAVDIVIALADKERVLKEKLVISEKENNKLKEDLNISVEDFQNTENSFSNLHKRYEQCKDMLHVYIENEKSLMEQLENMNVRLNEKEEKCKALQSGIEDKLHKFNSELASVKSSFDGQISVLKAQLQKAEMKISILESNIKLLNVENCELKNLYEDLISKFSKI